MIYDPALIDKLSSLEQETFDGEVYRVTGFNSDPTASSLSGGRWAPPPTPDAPEVPVLYTSLERNGAIAEVAAYLLDLTPIPRKPLKLHTLAVTTRNTIRLLRAGLNDLGVDMARYGERNYRRTQEIGATVNFLGFDGLIVESARWSCDNLMLYTGNHSINERLDVSRSETIDWHAWARETGLAE